MNKYIAQVIAIVVGCVAISIAYWKTKSGMPLWGLFLVALMVDAIN